MLRKFNNKDISIKGKNYKTFVQIQFQYISTEKSLSIKNNFINIEIAKKILKMQDICIYSEIQANHKKLIIIVGKG